MDVPHLSVLEASPTASVASDEARRLVVLVPRVSAKDIDLPPFVEGLAEGRPVVLVGLAETARDEDAFRRRFSANGEGRQLVVVRAADWSTALDGIRRDGDVLVFPSTDGSGRPTATTQDGRRRWAGRLIETAVEWVGPLLIVAAFFVVQVRIDRASSGPVHVVLLSATVLVEIAALWRWERWFSARLTS